MGEPAMIEITQGNLLNADVEALVNTVNCVGYMGKGIALQFKKAFPQNFEAYQRACKKKEVRPGKMFVFETDSMVTPKYIINFPTKRHWRGKSHMEDIESGLKALIKEVKRLNLTSIALPPLGCGLGGLKWNVVRPMIEQAFAEFPDIRVMLFAPVRTTRPKMTAARALFIKLMEQYTSMAYRMTLLEIHKLAYFLQEAGEPLRLGYEPGIYGPYAANLNKVLEILEGHFIRGYGDSQRPDEEIELMPGAIEAADLFLIDKADSKQRVKKVDNLIEGFETPYGMELLSSVHWVAVRGDPAASDANSAIERVHQWNDRKRKMFKPDHIRIAWERLQDEGWIL
jgi:O-acetyl-ADP-ribose deacetylase (regulator of RNase III)